MCLVKADGGFEVFSRTDDARLVVRFFEDEAAYFCLFGILAAEAVRSGWPHLARSTGVTFLWSRRKRFEVPTEQEVTQIRSPTSYR
jgi:hypothetical protein